MFIFLMSLMAMMTPTGTVAPSAPLAAVQASPPATVPAPFAWLNGTWKTDALEMTCKFNAAGTACREEGRSEAMKGAQADLTITPAAGAPGSQLKVALPSIPPSTFREIAREAQSVTYEMPTKLGIARLRFTREGDVLKVERGNAEAWATTMTYQRG